MDEAYKYKNYPNYGYFKEKIKSIVTDDVEEEIISAGSLFGINQLVGKTRCSLLVEFELPFPKGLYAFELTNSNSDLRDLKLNAIKDGVIVEGYLHKNISYISVDGIYGYSHKGSRLDACHGTEKTISTSIPFSGFCKLVGVRKGEMVEIESMGIEESSIVQILKEPWISPKINKPLFKWLEEKNFVWIDVKVLRKAYVPFSKE